MIGIPAAEMIVSGMTNPPAVTHGRSRASYSPKDDEISMPSRESFQSDESYFAVLFHELTHSTGAKSRLDRPLESRSYQGGESYGKEELIAELGASFLCSQARISSVTEDGSASYLAEWIKVLKGNPKMILQASGPALKASRYIMDTLPKETATEA